MKKQSNGSIPDRQDVSTVTPFPGQSLEGSKPRGLYDHHHSQPTHLKKGAAESRTAKPVEMPEHEGNAIRTGVNDADTKRDEQNQGTPRTHGRNVA